MMSEADKIKRSRFERNFIAIPYIIFGLIVALAFIFSPIPVVLVTIFGIFTFYNVVALFIAFLLGYGRTTLYLIFMTLCMAVALGILIYLMVSPHG